MLAAALEVIDVESLRTAFSNVTEGKNEPQAYSVITEGGQLTDLQIADLWLYSDRRACPENHLGCRP